MDTIIEDFDSDYVVIPIPSSSSLSSSSTATTTADHDYAVVFSILSRTEKSRIYSRLIHAYGDALFKTTTIRSREWCNRSRITHFWKANNGALLIRKSLSGFRSSLQTNLLKPLLQYYLNDLSLSSSSIYSAYDCVSETIIDGSGNRLILPGSCVDLDFIDEPQSAGGNGKATTGYRDTGTLIVPAYCANNSTTCLKHDSTTTASPTIPLPPSSSSSMWASNTIMVSAHDLLAVKRDRNVPQSLSLFDMVEEEEQQQQQGRSQDYRYYYRDEYIATTTTQNLTQQWSRALWKLTKRKTINMWYYNNNIGYISFRRSIKNIRQRLLIINPQQLLIKYCKSNTRRISYCRSLLLSSSSSSSNTNTTGFANNGDECDMYIHAHDEDNNRDDKEKISDSIFIVPLENKRCRLIESSSFDGRQSSAHQTQTVNEYDGSIVGSSREGPFLIEMTTFMSNNN